MELCFACGKYIEMVTFVFGMTALRVSVCVCVEVCVGKVLFTRNALHTCGRDICVVIVVIHKKIDVYIYVYPQIHTYHICRCTGNIYIHMVYGLPICRKEYISCSLLFCTVKYYIKNTNCCSCCACECVCRCMCV